MNVSRIKLSWGFLTLSLTLLALGGKAAGETLDANRLMELARVSNPSLVSARLGEAEAAGRLEAARGALFPTLSLDSRASWIANPEDAVRIDAGSFGSIPVPSPVVPTLLPATDVTIAEEQDPFYYSAALSMDQALWTWGKIPAGIALREKEGLAARTNGNRAETSTLADLQKALYALDYQREALSIMETQMELSDRMLSSLALSRAAGAVTDLDYDSAALDAERLKRSAANLSDSVAKSERYITLLAGLDPAGNYRISTGGLPEIPDIGGTTLTEWARRARAENLDLAYASQAVEIRNAAAELSRLQGAGRPDVGLNLRAGWNGSRLPGEEDWSDKGDWFVTVSVAAKGNLVDFGVSSGKIRESEAAADRAAADFAWTAAQVDSAVATSLSSLETLRADLDYKERRVAFQDAKVRDAEARLTAGAATELAVLEAQSEHLSAVLDQASARMQYTDAWVSFLLLAAPAELGRGK